MKKKGLVITLVITLLTVFSITTVSYGATALGVPKVTVKSVNQDYLKISWNKVTGATKYSVYRSPSKYGTYKKVKTTSARYYNDKTVKNKTTYFYKVRASKGGTYGKYSIAKSGKIAFNGKITLSKDFFPLQEGSSATVMVNVKGTNDDVVASYDNEHLNVDWGTQLKDGSYPLYISLRYIEKGMNFCNITLTFENHKRIYKQTIKIPIDFTLWYNPDIMTGVKNYINDPDIPDFGAFCMTAPAYLDRYSDGGGDYVYNKSDILSNGFDADDAVDTYEILLESKGFYLVKETGTIDEREIHYENANGTYLVVIEKRTNTQDTIAIVV